MRVASAIMSTTTMRAAVVPAAGAAHLELRDVALPQPGTGDVRIKVEACGVCHASSRRSSR
jgi:alcohol dehydrogenase, propanol-preferring